MNEQANKIDLQAEIIARQGATIVTQNEAIAIQGAKIDTLEAQIK